MRRNEILKKLVAGAAAVAVVLGIGTQLNSAHAASRDVIPFANHGAIKDWKVENDRSMLIHTNSGETFRATFISRCHSLPFSETLGFVTSPNGELDKFGAVVVHDQTCRIKTLERIG